MADQSDVTTDTPGEPELTAIERGMGKAARWVLLAVLIIAGLLVGQAISRAAAPMPKIGIVRLYDVIDYGTAPYYFGPLQMARDRNDVAAVVILVDSPGGYATVSEELRAGPRAGPHKAPGHSDRDHRGDDCRRHQHARPDGPLGPALRRGQERRR